jgi:demethylmenaquinone methyltransferase/2-methoxy-6-polyprenyl-1,4-benzoquinol methylase
MLEKAQQLTAKNGWENVELVCSDAAQFAFQQNVDGILSTFALILIPECGHVVENGCQALRTGGRFSVLDMCWPDNWSFHWRHVFFWLRPYGVTDEILERRPWNMVWERMAAKLLNFRRDRFWYGMMYLASGSRE